MKRKTLIGFLIALSLVPYAHAGMGDAIAGGAVAGLVTGLINAATQHRQPQTVVIEKRTVVVHDRAVQHGRSSKKSLTTDPSPSPTPQLPSTPPAPSVPVVVTMPVVATVAPTPPTPTPSGPVFAVTDPITIDNPTDLTPKEMGLLQDKHVVLNFFEDYFKRTTPQYSLADSSLFMEVKIGAYNYLVAKITVNTELGTVVKGFVIDLKNEYFGLLSLDTYHEFMHTGNINLLGERVLNPLD
jgi:hypothetical protein